jgi:hypothetical protein
LPFVFPWTAPQGVEWCATGCAALVKTGALLEASMSMRHEPGPSCARDGSPQKKVNTFNKSHANVKEKASL